MTETITSHSDRISSLLAEKGYEVTEPQPNLWKVRESETGIVVSAVLEGDILFFSLPCITVPESKLTPEILRRMLASDNGISTSHFQLYTTLEGNVSITLNNFCKLQDMGPEDEDDILSCLHFLVADVADARNILGNLAA